MLPPPVFPPLPIRIATSTDSEGWTLTYSYDAADRITAITYPDGTSQTFTYDKLDLASVTDRLGRVWTYAHDADRRLVSTTDPQGEKTLFAYNPSGKLTGRTDPKGNLTQWAYDVEGRPTTKTYADNSTLTYAYETATSRLLSTTDALNQTKTFAYAEDDRPLSITYAGAMNPTPNVAFDRYIYLAVWAGYRYIYAVSHAAELMMTRPSILPAGLMPGRPPLRAWRLTLEAAEQITPRMRRLSFTAPDLEEMAWTPGQDLVLNLPDAPRRHYTIRSMGEGTLAIDFVLHGHGVAAEWARTARIGDQVEALGPRGRTRLASGADWNLFLGDETCIPAIFAMLEALPAGARAWAFLEVESAAEKQEVATRGEVELEWIVRGGPARPNTLLLDRLRSFRPPDAAGHACIIGETSGVRAERHWLLGAGWRPEQITAEGYWRPGRHGGHDHV